MAGTFGYGLRGFAGGFQTGLGLGMERKKIKMLQEEQKRAEKLAKEKEENAMNWLNSNKDSLVNFQTQPQDIRNMLIFESIKYSDDWHDYLRDCEDALQTGDLEELKHLNDMEEEKIKAERDMLGLGVRPENAFIGKHYSEENMNYLKKLQMGKLPIKPIGIKMYEEEFGELPPEVKKPDLPGAITYLKKFPNPTSEQFSNLKTGAERYFNVDLSNVTQESLWKPEVPEITPGGEITAGEKRTYDMASSVLFGSSDFVTGITKPGIISSMISSKLNMGQSLTEEEKTEVRNNYNLIKGTLPSEIISSVEAQLQRYGIPLEAPVIEPTITPEAEPKKWWEFWKGETTPTTPTTPGVTPKVGEISPIKVPTEEKEALIPTMSNKELYDTLRDTDPSDPIYKSLYDEAVKRGLITK